MVVLRHVLHLGVLLAALERLALLVVPGELAVLVEHVEHGRDAGQEEDDAGQDAHHDAAGLVLEAATLHVHDGRLEGQDVQADPEVLLQPQVAQHVAALVGGDDRGGHGLGVFRDVAQPEAVDNDLDKIKK